MSWILLLLLFKELWGNVDSSSSEVLGEEPRPKIILAQFGAAEMEFGDFASTSNQFFLTCLAIPSYALSYSKSAWFMFFLW